MLDKDLIENMTFTKKGNKVPPLSVHEVNGTYRIGVYQGGLSKYDILIKYRQKIGSDWSRRRTPKHIHWAVDVLLKLQGKKKQTQEFLDFLLNIWSKVQPITSKKAQKEQIDIDSILQGYQSEIAKHGSIINGKGEYSVKFLIVLAKLLMIQEKTNRSDAHKFEELLNELRDSKDIFSVISKASYTGRG
ncbi:hypothetical protein JYU19_00500 [bacterium AH-315-J21]|nr:hypothetical protein [bacterium AH-315-J21]